MTKNTYVVISLIVLLVIIISIWLLRTEGFDDKSNHLGKWCSGGIYSDGRPIHREKAGVGAIVCGGNDRQHICRMNPDGSTYWDPGKTHVLCTSNQKGNTLASKWCPGGIYSNGTIIPQKEAGVGAIVCGGNDRQHICRMNPDGTTYWDPGKTHVLCTSNQKGNTLASK
ncbi:hypothetical protein Indivirus_9_5 [Indivirus ILV1]|uniref:Uncharacterized protein n=1 Tax=Indivirus ILV1 TaxID=1977633 RepID=A0A1V0SEF9_9VIRU|nr:hypothetical protein Indivirus_9_5 [Indivirus ILV1]